MKARYSILSYKNKTLKITVPLHVEIMSHVLENYKDDDDIQSFDNVILYLLNFYESEALRHFGKFLSLTSLDHSRNDKIGLIDVAIFEDGMEEIHFCGNRKYLPIPSK